MSNGAYTRSLCRNDVNEKLTEHARTHGRDSAFEVATGWVSGVAMWIESEFGTLSAFQLFDGIADPLGAKVTKLADEKRRREKDACGNG